MPRKTKRTISLIFTIATIMSTTAMIYSFSYYSGGYAALHTFNASISEFNVIEFNATHIRIETILTLTNPSPQEFRALLFEQRTFLNGQFFTFTRASEPSGYRPMQIPPQSSTNVTISTNVPPNKIEMFQEITQRSWSTSILIILDGPVIGRYSMTISREIGAS